MKLISKQCKAARNLLRWNVADLSTKSGVPHKRIDLFEKGFLHLVVGENDSLVGLFKQGGIHFMDNYEVVLDTEGNPMLELNALKDAKKVALNPVSELFSNMPYKHLDVAEQKSSDTHYHVHTPTD
jgi:hypothetical protein